MKKIISTFLILFPLIILGKHIQLIKKHEHVRTPLLPDISINTFYNTYDTCEVSWTVIKDSMPSNWGVSFVFQLVILKELQVVKAHLIQTKIFI